MPAADADTKAAAEMDSAEKRLTSGSPTSALQPEQRALQQLQRAEAVFREIQISTGQQGGGGGGGGQQRTNAQDLADKLSELLRDPVRATQFGLAGQRAIEDRYHAPAMARETLRLYRRLVATRPAA